MVVAAAGAALAQTSAVHSDGHIDSRLAVAVAASSPLDSQLVYRSRRATAKGARHDCTGTEVERRGRAGIAEEEYIADIARNLAVGSSSPRHSLIHAVRSLVSPLKVAMLKRLRLPIPRRGEVRQVRAARTKYPLF